MTETTDETPPVPASAPRRWDWRPKLRWFAAEIVVVVAGVLIALALNAWGNERAARAQERELLQGLRAEFAANLALFNRTADEHRRSIEQARRMLAWTGPDPAEVDTATVDSLLFSLISEIPSFHPAMGEFAAILGSGQLALIQNDSIRTAVAAWPGAVELLRETEDEMRSDVIDRFYPYVLERTPLLTMDRSVGFLDFSRPSRFERGYEALLSEVAFENHTENRWVMAQFILEDGEPVRRALVDVIRLIDAELGE
jgi:hypothetical protein